MAWSNACSDWQVFLDEVRAARADLRCSISGAWFRGHSDGAHALVPSLFRQPMRIDPDFKAEWLQCRGMIDSYKREFAAKRRELERCAAIEDESRRRDEQSRVRGEMQQLRRTTAKTRDQLKPIELVPSGERDAYVEWCFRSGKKDEPSWLVLAEMQHSGVPTRLLDWSESLLVSLFFATARVRAAVDAKWLRDSVALESLTGDPSTLELTYSSAEHHPTVWVFNPYRASERATDRLRIWDLSRDRFDYYQAFVVQREWPFEKAIPAFSPWSSGRIAAQQGLFTVAGYDRRPMDEQLGPTCLRKVVLTPGAALYAVRFLREVGGFDHFSLYRDLDSLATGLKRKFFH